MTRAEHGPDVIRQRQKCAHRNVHGPVCGRSRSLETDSQVCRRTLDRPFSPVRQPHNNQTRPTPRPAVNDRETAAVKRVMRVNDPDLSDSAAYISGIMR